jgi:hypothetical protein
MSIVKRRRGSDIIAAVFLLVALAIAALWVRGLYARDQLTTQIAGHKLVIAIFPQHVYVIAVPATSEHVATRLVTGLPVYPSRPRYWEVQYRQRPGVVTRVGVPFWLPLMFAVVPPLWWLIQRLRNLRRHRDGLCRECGYDLRASRERCPECGTPIVAKERRVVTEHIEHTESRAIKVSRRYPTTLHWQISLKQ